MPIPQRKARKNKPTKHLPRKPCPMCGSVVILTSGGKVPRHRDGKEWCVFQYLKPEQYNLLVREGLMMSKRGRAMRIVESVLTREGLTINDLIDEVNK